MLPSRMPPPPGSLRLNSGYLQCSLHADRRIVRPYKGYLNVVVRRGAEQGGEAEAAVAAAGGALSASNSPVVVSLTTLDLRS